MSGTTIERDGSTYILVTESALEQLHSVIYDARGANPATAPAGCEAVFERIVREGQWLFETWDSGVIERAIRPYWFEGVTREANAALTQNWLNHFLVLRELLIVLGSGECFAKVAPPQVEDYSPGEPIPTSPIEGDKPPADIEPNVIITRVVDPSPDLLPVFVVGGLVLGAIGAYWLGTRR